MVCNVCGNPDGPCMAKTRDCSFFISELLVNSEDWLNVPCYVRNKINMICVGRSEVPVSDDVGINYTFNVAKNESVTSFYGWGWKEFLINSNSRAGDFIIFQMTNNSDTPIKVAPCKSATMSQISKVQADTSSGSYSESSDEEPDEVYDRHSVVVMTRPLDWSTNILVSWRAIINRRGTGLGPLFIHKLTATNINRSLMKIPTIVVQGLQLEPSGAVVLSVDNTPDVVGQFYPSTDGRMIISPDAWEDFTKKKGLVADQVVMFLFHPYGDIMARRQGVVISVDVI